MTDPISHLLEEHRAIMAEVAALRRAIQDLRQYGEAAVTAAIPALESVGRMMATRLLRHARKEDEALFPAIEEALGMEHGPTSVMRQEHRDIHEQARRFRDTLKQLEEVEHPAIVAGGERLRTLAARGAGAAALADTGESVVNLLDVHFAKEEDILFPMARDLLSREALERIGARIEDIEREATP